MKVIYDCTVLDKWTGHATGIQRVVEELGRELVRCMPTVVLGVFDQDGACWAYSLESRQIGARVPVACDDVIFSAGHDWDYLDHFAVIQAHIARGVRFVVLCYDTIPLLFPFTYSTDFVSRFDYWLKQALQTSSLVFSISKSTRADIVEYAYQHNLTAPEIEVLRLGDHLPVASSADAPSAEIVGRTRMPYILSVGTLEFRKNHRILLDAYRYMIEDMNFMPPKLYIVGKQGELDGGVRQQAEGDLRLRGLVEVLHGVTDADLHALYRSALFTVYPSIYEGWGLPVAESLHYGKPCITSGCSSMLEIAPECVRFVHPLCPDQWAKQISFLSSDPCILEDECRRVRESYRPISWRSSAARVALAFRGAFPGLSGT